MTLDESPDLPPCRLWWHDSPRALSDALRSAGPDRVRRVHTFRLRPGLLGGLYSASFAEGRGAVHRCVFSYIQPALLQWEVRPLEETLGRLAIPEVEGRVEIGLNSGEILHYFLTGADEDESPIRASARRKASHLGWLRAARELGDAGASVRPVGEAETEPVLCASAGRDHLLIRLDGAEGRTVAQTVSDLGVSLGEPLSPSTALGRDVFGQWRER